MTQAVTAGFDTIPQAEEALAHVSGQVALLESAVVARGHGAHLRLDRLQLTPQLRTVCEEIVERAGVLLVAIVPDQAAASSAIDALNAHANRGRNGEPAPAPPPQRPAAPPPRAAAAPPPDEEEDWDIRIEQPAPPPQAAAAPAEEEDWDIRIEPPAPPRDEPVALGRDEPPAPPAEATPAPAAEQPVAEERIPLVDEELRIGKREVVRGGARVHSRITETPVAELVQLIEEKAVVDRRPADRRLSDEEVAAAGLLKERVIEVSEMREEAVVSKEAYVREELVVRKTIEQRVERVEETLRRTEAEVEEIPPERRSAFGGFGSGAPGDDRRS